MSDTVKDGLQSTYDQLLRIRSIVIADDHSAYDIGAGLNDVADDLLREIARLAARRPASPTDTQPDERELRLASIRAFDAECTIDEILSMLCRDPHDERDPIVIASEIVWKMRAEIEALKAAPHRPEIDVDGLARAIVDAIDGYDGVLYSERHRLTTGILTRHLTAPGDGGQGQ